MSNGFLGEIVNAYGGLRASMRKQIERKHGEERLLALVMFDSFAIFLSFLPTLLAQPIGPDQSIAAGIIMWFFVVMFFAPLLFYGVAAISHIIARFFGATGPFFGARHAFFWMLVVISPILLLKAMLASVFMQIADPTGQMLLNTLNIILAFSILRFWGAFLAEAENFKSSVKTSAAIALIFMTIIALIYLVTI